MDPNAELALRWQFDSDDIRKVTIWMVRPDQEDLKLYYFVTYERTSTYYRFNLATGRYENAGNIEWLSVYHIRLNMGLRALTSDALVRKNKPNSRSRRFKGLNNVEYKWKPVDDEPANLECMTVAGKKFVALYTPTDQMMKVHPRGQPVLDDVVVTCLLHLHRRSLNFDFVVPAQQASTSGAAAS